MTGEQDVPRDSATPLDRDGLLARVRAAEAKVEELRHAVLSQERLADRLVGVSSPSPPDVLTPTQRRTGFPSNLRSSLRALVRRIKARVHGAQESPLSRTGSALEQVRLQASLHGEIEDRRYSAWIEFYDTVDDQVRASLRVRLDALADRPLVSVIFPVYNTPEDLLREAIESVQQQLYGDWELCISDDRSTEAHVAKVLDEYSAADDRIHVIRRETNGHISASSNSAISIATGQWLCLMDHDDLLPKHALAVAMLALSNVPDAGLLYSDEDHVNLQGERSTPYFKPDFDPLLILGQNYFSHLCMIRRDLVDRIGGFRTGVEGSRTGILRSRHRTAGTPADRPRATCAVSLARPPGVHRFGNIGQAVCGRSLSPSRARSPSTHGGQRGGDEHQRQ